MSVYYFSSQSFPSVCEHIKVCILLSFHLVIFIYLFIFIILILFSVIATTVLNKLLQNKLNLFRSLLNNIKNKLYGLNSSGTIYSRQA